MGKKHSLDTDQKWHCKWDTCLKGSQAVRPEGCLSLRPSPPHPLRAVCISHEAAAPRTVAQALQEAAALQGCSIQQNHCGCVNDGFNIWNTWKRRRSCSSSPLQSLSSCCNAAHRGKELDVAFACVWTSRFQQAMDRFCTLPQSLLVWRVSSCRVFSLYAKEPPSHKANADRSCIKSLATKVVRLLIFQAGWPSNT